MVKRTKEEHLNKAEENYGNRGSDGRIALKNQASQSQKPRRTCFCSKYEGFYSLCDVNQEHFSVSGQQMGKEQVYRSCLYFDRGIQGGWGVPIGLLWCGSFGELGDWKEYTVHNFSILFGLWNVY